MVGGRFGKEVFRALDDVGLGAEKQGVKRWYDGFTFGKYTDIYDPWSITSFIKKGKYAAYWSNTSGNGLVNSLIQRGNTDIKQTMEELLRDGSFEAAIDEQIVFSQLDGNADAVWSLLLVTGYLKVLGTRGLISNFDTAKGASSKDAPERFYHGFVLGMLVDLAGRYTIKSNRERGKYERGSYGRYDIMLKPRDKENDFAYIIEFKVHKPRKEKNLEETLANALAQIEERQYEAGLIAEGFAPERIRKYGFVFQGKECLIG